MTQFKTGRSDQGSRGSRRSQGSQGSHELALDEPGALDFYIDALTLLNDAGIEFLVGGGFAYAHYSGIDRRRKDLDIFVRPADVRPLLARMEADGYATELSFPHWLGKIRRGDYLIDVIFGSGNGIARVDHEWFQHSVPARIADVPVRLCPPEEMIWSKAFIQERERFDGADVMHIIRAVGPDLDWVRLLQRFDRHWRVLLSSIVIFGFVYPLERDRVPSWVADELLRRFADERPDPSMRVCQGTLLSRSQYQWDIGPGSYVDARVSPPGPLSPADLAIWDAAIEDD